MSNLPIGYTLCEYIESNGTQYIDTGVIAKSGIRTKIDCSIDDLSLTSNIFGAYSNSNRIYIHYDTSEKLLLGYRAYNRVNYNLQSGTRYLIDAEFKAGKQSMLIDGTEIYSGTDTSEITTNCSAFLGAMNSGTSASLFAKMTIYSCQIYDNDVLVRDYVPMANEQGVCGLWDNVNGVFYTSANGNNFLGIRKDDGLPVGYTLCEYIESNGTQYIDTGFKPNQDTRVVVDFKGLKWNTNEVCMWMGVSSSPSFMFGKASSSNYRAYFYYNTSEVLFAESTTEEWEHRQTLDWDKNVVTWGSVSKSISSASFKCVDNAYLFAANNGGEAKFMTRGRIYGCQIYDNEVLARDYVPMANEQGVCGLWDNANGVFYVSPNGNNFVGVIAGSNLPIGYTRCEYVESNGTQYIDTGVAGHANVKAESEFMLMEGGASIPLGCYSPNRLYMISFDSNTYLRYGYSEWFNTSTKIEIGRKYSISVDFASGNQSMVLDGVTIASSSILGRVTNDYNIYAFAYNDGGIASDFSKIRFYGLKLYQEGLLVRDYIPCQNSEGDYGLYDLVNNVFYQSETEYGFTGKWVVDKKLLVSPEEFRRRLMSLPLGYTAWRGVYIEDINGKLWDIDEWDSSVAANGIAVLTDNCRFVMCASLNRWTAQWAHSNTTGVYACTTVTPYRSEAVQVFSGYEDTKNVLANIDTNVAPAWSIIKDVKFPNGQSSYMGSAGEWQAAFENYQDVRRAVDKIGAYIDEYGNYATSTMYDSSEIWVCSFAYGGLQTIPFNDYVAVCPFTTLKL